MDTDLTPAAEQDARLETILRAGFDVFQAYGFRRTSMEDVAQAAGMSRSALYQYVRNKEDLLQRLLGRYFETAAHSMEAALLTDTSPVEQLEAALLAKSGEATRALLESPHGAELLDAKTHVNAEVVERGEARIVAVLAAWLDREAARGRIILPAETTAEVLARVILKAANGMKAGTPDFDSYEAELRLLARSFGHALSA